MKLIRSLPCCPGVPRLLPLLALLLTCVGCQTAPYHAGPNPMEIDPSEFDRLFQASTAVLREEGYVVDREDYRFGAITTQPRPSATLLEPWKGDNTTFSQAAESTLNKQRRSISVTIAPPPADEVRSPDDPPRNPHSYDFAVEVLIEQEQSPRRSFTGSTVGPRVVRPLNDTPAELKERGIANAYWQPVGRDPYLERRLMGLIVRRSLSLPAASSAAPVDVTTAPPTEQLVD